MEFAVAFGYDAGPLRGALGAGDGAGGVALVAASGLEGEVGEWR